MSDIKTLAEMKATLALSKATLKSNAAVAASLAGTKFLSGKGATGEILPTVSAHGKVQARFTCIVPGCTETHDREQSDFHQVGACRTHVGKSTGGSPKTPSIKKASLTPEQELAALEARMTELKAAAAMKAETAQMNAVLYGS